MKFNLKSLFVVFTLAIVMTMGLAACGTEVSETDAGESEAAEAPAADDAGEESAETGEESAEAGDIVAAYVFTNTGAVDICELYLSPASQEEWGVDQLAGQTIAVGAEFTLKNIPAGLYDAKAIGCDGSGEAVGQLDIQN
ncbi:MAG: hypothetical protein CVU44_22535 [Chloroflexi bacterium HGW-Chloroflexi-6]|nr:MAG: hypothetical protein CVU44_22535 [Chloroflexi bacterium HGW-Chloroflexi-6]